MDQIDLIIIGDLVNTHGLRGEVKILSDSDFKEERFIKGNTLLVVDNNKKVLLEVKIKSYRTHKNFDLLTFEGLDSIQDVEKYKGCQVAIYRDAARDLADEEGYYHAEILACDIYDQENNFVGNVHKIVATPAYDLWYIKRAGLKDLILPFVEAFVEDIDITNKKIVIQLIEGMEK